MSRDEAWDNPGFHVEEYPGRNRGLNEGYQIPRAGLNREASGRLVPSEAEVLNGIPRPSYGSRHENVLLDSHFALNQKNSYDVTPSPDEDTDEEDYSLKSYFKDSACFKSLESTFNACCKREDCSKILRKIYLSLFVVLYIVYFIAVLILPHYKQEEEDYWCNGDGFLILITAFVLFFVFYFKIFKPRVGKKVYKIISSTLNNSSRFEKFKEVCDSWYTKLIAYVLVISAVIIFLVVDAIGNQSRLISLIGIFVLVLFGFLFSAAPRKVIWRQVVWGLGLQFAMGLVILRWSVGKAVFDCFGSKVNTFLSFSDEGSKFVFGTLVSELAIFGFKVLTVILFFSFCIQILYYYGAMQWVVIKLGWLLQVTVGTTACESVNAAANIFLGQSEAPLLIKPFLLKMTKSELHAVMTGGFATIAGAVLAAYISFGVDPAHLLSASVMSAPAALGFSKLFYPEVEKSQTHASDIRIQKGTEANVLHAACEGVSAAIPLVANIAANLIAFIAFIAFIDAILNWGCLLVGIEDGVCSLSAGFGYAFMPLAWIMGVPWKDCYHIGQLIGIKTIVNEFVGYLKLTEYIKNNEISKRSEVIATYALCGFSNIGSIGIQLGALGAMAPERRGDLAKIAVRAMIAGTVACFLTACVAGTLLSFDEDIQESSPSP